MAKTSWDRRGEVRAALRTVVSDPDYGVTALSSPQVMSGLLKDLLPDSPREVGVLVAAAEAHLADMLHDHRAQGMDSDTACALAAQAFGLANGGTRPFPGISTLSRSRPRRRLCGPPPGTMP